MILFISIGMRILKLKSKVKSQEMEQETITQTLLPEKRRICLNLLVFSSFSSSIHLLKDKQVTGVKKNSFQIILEL